MYDWNTLTRMEQSLLLGLLPLLGATAQVGTAVAAVLILLAARLLVRAADRLTAGRFDPPARWALFAALAFAAAYAITVAAGFVMPVPGTATPWLLATGLTPLVFCALPSQSPSTARAGHLQRVCVLILILGLIREPLGSGTLFGEALWRGGSIPFGLLGSSAGAYLLLGAVALGDVLFAATATEDAS